MHDVFGNSVGLVDFQQPSASLIITCTLKIERWGIEAPAVPIAPEAEFYTSIYSSSDRIDLRKKTGACRDFAMTFIEAVCYLGFGARLVSGYLYDPALDEGITTQAVAATHA